MEIPDSDVSCEDELRVGYQADTSSHSTLPAEPRFEVPDSDDSTDEELEDKDDETEAPSPPRRRRRIAFSEPVDVANRVNDRSLRIEVRYSDGSSDGGHRGLYDMVEAPTCRNEGGVTSKGRCQRRI
jgi:hypothetical protein